MKQSYIIYTKNAKNQIIDSCLLTVYRRLYLLIYSFANYYRMKKNIIRLICISFCVSLGLVTLSSCTDLDFLEQKPASEISPEVYFDTDAKVFSYVIRYYPTILTATDLMRSDESTDNQGCLENASTKLAKFTQTLYKTPGDNDGNGEWDFNEIYICNYFFQQILPKWKAGEISGDAANIEHCIGEMYFLRAFAYFKKLQSLGDFPIVRTLLSDDQEELTKASQRSPRNEVARFILTDLDSAKLLLKDAALGDKNRNRLTKACAQLFSSRVALFEATWEKNFQGTAFVPNGPGWTGKDKDYNANYQFPSGSIEGEIDFFLNKAMEDAKAVADAVELTENTYLLQQSTQEAINPYYDMFAQTDMSKYPEVLLWRQYDNGLSITHGNNSALQEGRINISRGFADSFLMESGLPIYDSGSGYHGDDSITSVRQDRDNRLFLFLQDLGQLNVLYPYAGSGAVDTVLVPAIVRIGTRTKASITGYNLRKGINFDASTCLPSSKNTTGILVFRAAEAYLNYIEACYVKTNSLDGTADGYWKKLRNRAGVDEDYNKTIAATLMSEEAKNDLAAYSAGSLVDATLYNIRRERRCELMAEGFRNSDLLRWRAMDQLITTPFHFEGFKLWGTVIEHWYDYYNNSGALRSYLTGNNNSSSNVSPKADSEYLRPYEKYPRDFLYGGMTWKMAHYLSPIAVKHFTITSDGGAGDVSTSPIYQNPGWLIKASEVAE